MTDRAPIDPQVAVDYMLQTAPRYAAAKAKRVQLEEFRKSKKAILMQQSVADREASAYAHPEYIELLNGLEAAVEAEELFRWKMKAAELQVEIWRSQEASSRAEGRAVR
jgi:hypothetical protein